MELSYNQRDSKPELSSHLKTPNFKDDPHTTFHDNHSDIIDIAVTQQLQQHTNANSYGFTNDNL